MMDITLLGTGTPTPHPERQGTANPVRLKEGFMLPPMGIRMLQWGRRAAPIFWIVLTFLPSCMMGDDFFSVTGRIVDDNGNALNSCQIALEAVEPGENAYPFNWEPTSSEIQRTYVWPFARGDSYRLVVSCPGFPDEYRTRSFEVSPAIRDWPEPVQFRTIVMTR